MKFLKDRFCMVMIYGHNQYCFAKKKKNRVECAAEPLHMHYAFSIDGILILPVQAIRQSNISHISTATLQRQATFPKKCTFYWAKRKNLKRTMAYALLMCTQRTSQKIWRPQISWLPTLQKHTYATLQLVRWWSGTKVWCPFWEPRQCRFSGKTLGITHSDYLSLYTSYA